MKIDQRVMPPAILAAFRRLVEELDAARLVDIATKKPGLFPGLRPLLANVPLFRTRIKSALETDLNAVTSALLQETALATEVVARLDTTALAAGFAALADYFGSANFLAAALLDKRTAVRELAHEFMGTWEPETPHDVPDSAGWRAAALKGKRPAVAALTGQFQAEWGAPAADQQASDATATTQPDALATFLEGLNQVLGECLPAASEGITNTSLMVPETATQQPHLSAAETDRLSKQFAREKKKLQDKIAQNDHEIARLGHELLRARQDSKLRATELSQVSQAAHELQETLHTRIEQGVQKNLNDTLRQWLVPVRQLNAALVDAQHSDLPSRAAELLERQRAVDLQYGNRTAMNGQIEQRRQLLAQIQHARREALNPLPELRHIAAQLDREIADLTQRLGLPTDASSPVVTALLATTNEAQTLDELAQMRQFIQQATGFNLLQKEDLEGLYGALNETANRLYDQAKITPEVSGEPAPSRFFLRRAVVQGEAFTLFIDGHNLLFELAEIFSPYFLDGIPKAKAREVLGQRLTRIFAQSGAEVILYFDGEEPTQSSLSAQVRVLFSGGTGAHRADTAILQHLLVLQQAGYAAPLCLVTRDTDFARQAKAMSVIILHPEEFAIAIDLAQA